MSYIYMIKNDINKKIYIGQTTKTLKQRFQKHIDIMNSKNRRTEISDAMKEYGVKHFWIESIEEGNFSKEELDIKEREYIKKYNSLYPNGYNLQTGGKCDGAAEITRKRLSKKLKGRSITWGDKVSSTMKEKWQDQNYRETMVKAHTHPYALGHYKKHTKPLRLDLPIEEINQLYESGMSIYAIAKRYGVSFYTIKKRIRKELLDT